MTRTEEGRVSIAFILIALLLGGAGFVAGREIGSDDEPEPTPTVTQTVTVTPTPSESPSETVAPIADCSAGGLDPTVEAQEGLPDAVVAIRSEMTALAVACDFDGLADLATGGAAFFSFSFGSDRDPAKFWREAEDFGDDVMATLVKVLDLPYCTQPSDGEVLFAWPSAYCGDASDADWEAVTAIYKARDVRRMKQLGNYIGYRVGITEGGDWQFYIAGD